MAPKFLEQNKKKGLLAALLLFLRRRTALSLLLLVVLLASTLIVAPSSLRVDLLRVAWLAQKAGVDPSGLVAAFRAAKTSGTSGSSGWGNFLGRAPQGGQTSSLDMVKASRKDLEGPLAGLAKPGSVKGVLTPEDAKAGGDGVAIAEGDLAGERKGFLEGVMKGLFGAGAGGAEISGGAYADKGFFSGSAGAGGHVDDRTKEALAGVGKVDVPKSSRAGRAAGRAADRRARSGRGRSIGTARNSLSLGNRAPFTQLAEASAQATLATDCLQSDCGNEDATTENGAVMDGRLVLGHADTPPAVTPGGAPSPGGRIKECADKAMKCQKDKADPLERLKKFSNLVGDYVAQMPGACGDSCNCSSCYSIEDTVRSICHGDLLTAIHEVQKSCDLPSYCADLGITDPSTVAAGAGNALCQMDLQKCGCHKFLCDLKCCGKHPSMKCLRLVSDPLAFAIYNDEADGYFTPDDK